MKKYLSVYTMIVKTVLKRALEYRFNLILRSTYTFVYLASLYFSLQAVFSRVNSIAGWQRDEIWLLFVTFNLMYGLIYLFFIEGFRFLLRSAVRTGAMDFYLLRPINPQFLVSVSFPYVEQIFYVIFLGTHLWVALQAHPVLWSPMSLVQYCLSFVSSFAIVWLVLSTYSSLAFFVTKSEQVIEVVDKVTDMAQYPPSIFPEPVKIAMFSFLPTAFLGYIPSAILLGKAEWWWLPATYVMAAGLFGLNQLAWRKGLRAYQSPNA
jgi:ABC-2 type transport system permease protein